MIKDIYYYLHRYYAERGSRDLCVFAVFTALIVGIYIFARNLNLGDSLKIKYARYAALSLWLAFCGVKTYFTAFRNYCDPQRSYSEMFFPVAPFTKYGSTFIRSFIFSPVLSMGLLWLIDSIWIHETYSNVETESFMEVFTAAGEPLNYLPLFPFYMFWINSIAFLATLYPRLISVSLLIITVFSIIILPGFNSSEYYPFVNMEVIYKADDIRWSSIYSCLGAKTSLGYLISYIWLIGLPTSILILSYYRFKESKLS